MFQNNVEPAIEHYHGLIARDPDAAADNLNLLIELQRQNRTLFGDRPLAYSVRPAFLTEVAYQEVQDTVYLLRQAILNVAAHFFNLPSSLEELGVEEWEKELIAIPTDVIRFAASARMDAFLTTDSFRFVEVNGESPAGAAYAHHLGAIYRQLPILKEFQKSHPVRYVSPLEHLVAGLLRTYHEEFSGQEAAPTFAIVDFLNVPTYHEFVLIKEYLERSGMTCEIADPRELELRDGWVYANGRRIDILYRRLLLNEYYEKRDECTAFFKGYVAQKTCYLNSFRTKLVHKKALFSFLTDETYSSVLTSQQKQAIRDHIPWTRRLRDRYTRFHDLKIDLLEFVRANKQFFVIKPNDEYGGKDVTLGVSATESEWDEAIERGFRNGYIVQGLVDIRKEPFLVFDEGDWVMQDTIIDLDPYLNGPLMGGCLARVSTGRLANVTAGGGTLPLFILRYD